jgi:predicted dehydrogenase
MGQAHLKYLPGVPDVLVSAICDIDRVQLDRVSDSLSKQALTPAVFDHPRSLIRSGEVDAVLIATPHYDHPIIGIDAFEHGLHVLVEKPIAVGVRAARQLIEAAGRRPDRVFGIMYNQRSKPLYAKLRALIASGELGEITRVSWIVTTWFRSHAYYASGGWRATWAGEGGGVLLNQCPHNLDLLLWTTGLTPRRVTAVGAIGKTHPIEVEDEVSAVIEFTNGATGHFVTSTGEFPGTNRLEIAGDRGKIICENDTLVLHQTRDRVSEVNATTSDPFPWIETWTVNIPVSRGNTFGEHERITRDFLSAIRNGTPLIAPGDQGVMGLELGNAMLASLVNRQSVELPLDGSAYDELIQSLIQRYGGRKAADVRRVEVDMTQSSASFR